MHPPFAYVRIWVKYPQRVVALYVVKALASREVEVEISPAEPLPCYVPGLVVLSFVSPGSRVG